MIGLVSLVAFVAWHQFGFSIIGSLYLETKGGFVFSPEHVVVSYSTGELKRAGSVTDVTKVALSEKVLFVRREFNNESASRSEDRATLHSCVLSAHSGWKLESLKIPAH